jgi:hypothetical protein
MQKEVTKGLLHASLRLLESGGYLRILSEFDKRSSVQILLDKERLRSLIKGSFNPVLKDLIVSIVREYTTSLFNKRVQIDLEVISRKSGIPENEVDAALEELDNMGLVSYSKLTGKENILLTGPRINTARLNLDYKRVNENYIRFQNKLQLMVDYAFTRECRFQYILTYFGENDPAYRCGKCDRCTTTSRSPGMSRDYVKELILRTLYASHSLINENAVIRILKATEKSSALKEIETFGSASNIERNELKEALSELIAERKIERNRINNKYLQLSPRGKEFLQQNKITESKVTDYNIDLELFNLLREARAKISKKFVQPAFLVCTDEVLRSIAEAKPKDKESLLKIHGYKDRMFIKSGHEFLEIINNFIQEPEIFPKEEAEPKNLSLPKNIRETYHLLTRKYSLKDIAALQKLSEAVVSMQVETILEYNPAAEINYLYDAEILKLINDKIYEGLTDLKLLKDNLPTEVPYAVIRIVLAKFRVMKKNPSASVQYEL